MCSHCNSDTKASDTRWVRQKYSADKKINVVLEGLKPNCKDVDIYQKYDIPKTTYYNWRRIFINAGKAGLREELFPPNFRVELLELRTENMRLKQLMEELTMKDRMISTLNSMYYAGVRFRRYKKYSASEKLAIISAVQDSGLPVCEILAELCLSNKAYYQWLHRYVDSGYEGLQDKQRHITRYWNETPPHIQDLIKELAMKYPYMGNKQLQWYLVDQHDYYVSSSTIYSFLKKQKLIPHRINKRSNQGSCKVRKTKRVNEVWQTDFTYLKKINGKWHFLSTVLDDYSRYIVAWYMTPTMKGEDAIFTIDQAVRNAKLDQMDKRDWPIILTDRGPCYKSKVFQSFIEEKGLNHIMTAPRRWAERARIERSYRSLKRAMDLCNCQTVADLHRFISEYFNYYNRHRSHCSLDNLRPIDVYKGREQEILTRRVKVKKETLREKGYLKS
ncbi:MAG: IS3 family transposase [Fidelibacterota bacterium]|nr:MAG: IS3 family transposase [Candidatus Neomarinimicrobiota bacterium]